MQVALKKQKSFKGGFIFRRLEGEPQAKLEDAGVPKRLHVLLQQGQPIVKVGQRVARGQVIGEGGPALCPVHAPASGVVVEVGQREGEGNPTPVVVIELDGKSDFVPVQGATRDVERLTPEAVQRILHEAGVSALFHEGFPSAEGGSNLSAADVKMVAISAISTEPFLPRPAVLLDGRVEEFAAGLRVLHQALPHATVVVAHSHVERQLFLDVERALGCPSWLRLHALLPKYPQEHPLVLTSTLLGLRRVPLSPAKNGVLVGDVQAVLHAKEAVVDGLPVTERVVALGGQAFEPTGYVRAKVGTPFRVLVEGRLKNQERACIVSGGLLRGRRVADLQEPVTSTTCAIAALPLVDKAELLGSFQTGSRAVSFSRAFVSALLPFARARLVANLQGERRPCVQCNYCEDVCPVGIIPHLLSKQVTHNLVEETERFGIFACIECGLCSYVCPSKIDLMADIQSGKRTLLLEKEKYDQTA
ncbi:MAG: 4Fe-4S dicluster domain-containing protein [candidate division KSB1 bacterium]|nr:4Fe-4S dicluster domain-containing protein [candidate division KSB1 bacterium]